MDNLRRAVWIAASILALPSHAQGTDPDDIAGLSLEDLPPASAWQAPGRTVMAMRA